VSAAHFENAGPLQPSHRLRLIAETLLMATLLHALAALVLGNFRFASFFERAHSGFQIREPRFNHLIRHLAITSLLRPAPKGPRASQDGRHVGVSAVQLNGFDSEQLSSGLALPWWSDRSVIGTNDVSGRDRGL
jgi:hypothetical protein